MESKKISKLTNAPILLATLPTWSSDGKKIAFQASLAGEANRSQIFIVNVDGTALSQITTYDVYTFDGEPVWCPDSTCIVFSRDVGGGPKLMMIDLANKAVKPLFKDILDTRSTQTSIRRSPVSDYFTFTVDREFYIFEIVKREIYPLNIVDVFGVSLYP